MIEQEATKLNVRNASLSGKHPPITVLRSLNPGI